MITWFAAALAALLAMPGIARAQLLSGTPSTSETVVDGDVFYVLPNQTVNIEADLVDGKVVNLRAVPAVVDAKKTIVAKWEAMDDGGVMLSIQNPFEQTLKFEMGMQTSRTNGRLRATSSCPIGGGMQNFEMWPHAIDRISVGRGRVLADKAAHVCN